MQTMRDTGAQDRGLTYAAGPVEHGQPRREHVRTDDLALALTAEEEERVELGVFEWHEPLVRTGPGDGDHDRCAGMSSSSRRSSSAT